MGGGGGGNETMDSYGPGWEMEEMTYVGNEAPRCRWGCVSTEGGISLVTEARAGGFVQRRYQCLRAVLDG